MTTQLHRFLPDAGALEAWAKSLASQVTHPLVVYLQGEMGTGKSAFTRAFLRALGVTGTIRSPTFTLLERYETVRGWVFHLDLYRIGSPEEMEYLGVRDLLSSPAWWFIEWPERGTGFLPAPDLQLELSYAAVGRDARMQAHTDMALQWLRSL